MNKVANSGSDITGVATGNANLPIGDDSSSDAKHTNIAIAKSANVEIGEPGDNLPIGNDTNRDAKDANGDTTGNANLPIGDDTNRDAKHTNIASAKSTNVETDEPN